MQHNFKSALTLNRLVLCVKFCFQDAVMDREEVEEWILPPDYDHTEAEARHLMQESDKDGVSTQAPSMAIIWTSEYLSIKV